MPASVSTQDASSDVVASLFQDSDRARAQWTRTERRITSKKIILIHIESKNTCH